MKTTNLMINDYVQLKDEYYGMPKGTIMQVAEVFIDSAYCQDINIAFEALEVPVHLLEPISLTSEILEKNGFKSWEHGYIWKERIGMGGQTTSATSPIEIIIYEGGHSVIMNPHDGKDFRGSIDNVHELQHALRLTGINKEIWL